MKIIKPCYNCGGTSFTNPREAGLVRINRKEDGIEVDTSQVLTVEAFVCHECGNVQMYTATENIK